MLHMVLEIALVLLTLAGGCCIVCFLYSYMLRPYAALGTLAVVWGVGKGDGLEQRVRSLMWLQSCGLLRCRPILVDCGLDEEGRAIAARLAERYPGLTLCARRELERRLREE